MSERRFTEKPELDPLAVRSLPTEHPALSQNRTLFPNTVVMVTNEDPDRILVSGANNRKIGGTVEKGPFKGYAIYCLSLEERATCPTDCEARAFCYGNGMQMARRHRIGDPEVFFDRVGMEIAALLDEHPGLLIRLHVLGDFPSSDYVAFWKDVLDENPKVACYGYTHRKTLDRGGDEIGEAIAAVKIAHPDRFRIRWSGQSGEDGAVIANFIPKKPRIEAGLVCPAQFDKTACCATCALCWDGKFETVVFVKHGQHDDSAKAEALLAGAGLDDVVLTTPAKAKVLPTLVPRLPAPAVQALPAPLPEPRADCRSVRAIDLPTVKPQQISGEMPELRHVKPSSLLIEASYQRDLSGKSIGLIKKIVAGWDWAKFKPPVCAETSQGLFVIDGQHTAIAAASHPDLGARQIPVMVVKREQVEHRAAAFVSQNTDRVVMSPLQVFHAEVVARKPAAFEMLKSVLRAGATIPRSPPKKGQAAAGEIVSISALRHVWAHGKPDHFERVLRIAVRSGKAPLNSLLIRGIDLALKREGSNELPPIFELDDAEIAYSVSKIDIERQAEEVAANAECGKYDALASLIDTYVWDLAEEYNELRNEADAPLALAS